MEMKKPKSISNVRVLDVGKFNIPLYIIFTIIIILIGGAVQSFALMAFVIMYAAVSGEEALVESVFSNPSGIMDFISKNPAASLLTLFLTIAGVIACILLAKIIDKRKLRDLGMEKKGFLKEYGKGILLGFGVFSIIILIEAILGAYTFDGINPINVSTLLLILFAIGFMIQSFEEEIIMRGYLLPSVVAKHSALTGVIVSSVVFSLIHLSNASFSIVAFINIVLIGLVFGLLYVITDNIWVVSGFHFIWNFAQGCIYGIEVSGTNLNVSLLKSTQVVGKELVNGGSFGAEGGIITTVMITVLIILLLVYMIKKKLIVK